MHSLVLGLLLVVAHTSAIAHTEKYGDGPHKHNGVLCAISFHASHENQLLNAVPPKLPEPGVRYSARVLPDCMQPADFRRIHPASRDPPLKPV